MNIEIKVIPHKKQRYDTCGDWQFKGGPYIEDGKVFFNTIIGGNLTIKVSDTGNWYYNLLIARHEMDEAVLCLTRGVTEKQVDEYDFAHPEAGSDSFSENTDAPYYHSHCDALASEWQFSRLLGVDWIKYSVALKKMGWDPTKKKEK